VVSPELLQSVAGRLLVDGWTAEAVAALRADAVPVPVVLLKGPAVARWLYADAPHTRSYTDVDLLVAPADVDRAADVLRRRLGYRGGSPVRLALAADHATTLYRERDGATVDLHWKLHGMEHLPADAPVWPLLTADAEELVVAGRPVPVPGVVARTLHVALHVEPDDGPASQPSEDLRRAVERVDRATWAAAAAMARALDVDAEMGARLRLQPAGAQLADDLGLPARASTWFAVRQAGTLGTRGVQVLVAPGSVREKTRRVARGLFPPGADLASVVRALSTVPACVLAWTRLRRAR
jgi:hypothetical protein